MGRFRVWLRSVSALRHNTCRQPELQCKAVRGLGLSFRLVKMVTYPSCYLLTEDREDRESQNQKDRFEFKSIGRDGMDVFGLQAFNLATCCFDPFAIV